MIARLFQIAICFRAVYVVFAPTIVLARNMMRYKGAMALIPRALPQPIAEEILENL